jgi:hypothetical protein
VRLDVNLDFEIWVLGFGIWDLEFACLQQAGNLFQTAIIPLVSLPE